MVRRAAMGVLLSVLIATYFAPAAQAYGPQRTVSGQVLIGSPTSDAARCAWLRGRQQGVVGWVIKLSASEGDGRRSFLLGSRGPLPKREPTVLAQIGIEFFRTLGSCASGAQSLGDSSDTMSFGRRGMQRVGTIPAGARYAVVGKWSPYVFVGYFAAADPGAAMKSTFEFSIWNDRPILD